MHKERPDFHDAELVLRVYELRREPVMRESRAAIFRQFWPRSYDDIVAVAKLDHPINAAYRQVGSYWEMVYAMARHGIVAPDYWAENNGEGLNLFARVHPYLTEIRRDFSPRSFESAEWIATQCESGRRLFAMFQARVRATLEAQARA